MWLDLEPKVRRAIVDNSHFSAQAWASLAWLLGVPPAQAGRPLARLAITVVSVFLMLVTLSGLFVFAAWIVVAYVGAGVIVQKVEAEYADYVYLREQGVQDAHAVELAHSVSIGKTSPQEAAALLQAGQPEPEPDPVSAAIAAHLAITQETPESRAEAGRRKADDLRAALAELHGLTGLAEVKHQVRQFLALAQVARARGAAEIPSMGFVFSGNPGTGKTTVARILGRILAGAGYLRDGHLTECGKSDLVGQYVGQTAPRVVAAVQRSLGGCLFIDEAYSLLEGGQFGQEAIDTLVQEVENHRGELAVILAGYSADMERFLSSNAGLRSRFPTVIHFSDYTPSEKLEIARIEVRRHKMTLAPEAEDALLRYFQHPAKPGEEGNGREVRNAIEAAVRRQAMRLAPLLTGDSPPGAGELNTLTAEDVAEPKTGLG